VKKFLFLSFCLLPCFFLSDGCDSSEKKATSRLKQPIIEPTVSMTIGTIHNTDPFYSTRQIIAEILNRKKEAYHIEWSIVPYGGSTENINAVLAGNLNFAIARSDKQYQAISALGDWEGRERQEKLRAVFSLYSESVTLVTYTSADIDRIAELKGKQICIGTPGSFQHHDAVNTLKAAKIDFSTDLTITNAEVAQFAVLFQKGQIDAFLISAVHPNDMLRMLTMGGKKIRFVPITGIKKLLNQYPYYTRTKIPVRYYPASENTEDIETLGTATTLITSVTVPDHIVYAITRELFENLDTFRNHHTALSLLTRERMLEGVSVPFHPGAMKYYTETGLK